MIDIRLLLCLHAESQEQIQMAYAGKPSMLASRTTVRKMVEAV
jgi:hypothetical protein